MSSIEKQPIVDGAEAPFTPQLLDVFYSRYDINNVDDLHTVDQVDLPHRNGETVEFVRINSDGDFQAFYIPGFTESITAKASFGLAMSEYASGLPAADITLIDQNRVGIDTNGKNWLGRPKKDALYSQALTGTVVIERVLAENTVQENETKVINDGDKVQEAKQKVIITHSMSSLVFQKMLRKAKKEGSHIFDGAHVVMLAPAGLYKKDWLLKLGYRFAKANIQEAKSPKDIHDVDKSMLQAGVKRFFANIPRTYREIRELAKVRLDTMEILASGIGSLAIVGYGEDSVFSPKQLNETAQKAMDYGATYLTPVSFDKQHTSKDLIKAERKAMRRRIIEKLPGIKSKEINPGQTLESTYLAHRSSVRGATHNDEQFNPERVANAVRDYLANILNFPE